MQPITDPPPIRAIDTIPSPTTESVTPNAAAALTSTCYQRASEAYQSVPTPPSTPNDTYQSTTATSDLSTPLMFELTRSKLERAAQGQMQGRRGGPSLRQIVLLSNVWSGALPQWSQEQARERELAEEEDRQRRKSESEWLDGILEEMLIDEGTYDDEEDENDRSYVSVSFRGDREVGDSGFLEEAKPPALDRDGRLADLTASLNDIDEESDADVPLAEEAAESDPEIATYDAPNEPFSLDDLPPLPESAPNSPPLPPRSPPIAVPDRPTRTSVLHSAPPLQTENYSTSASPPLYPPALTPDSSPPSAGPVSQLGSSADSFDREVASRFEWLGASETRRIGILALDLPYSSRQVPEVQSDLVDPADDLSFDTLSFSTPEASSSKTPISSLSNSLALSLIPREQKYEQQQQQRWTPRPPRSLSVPASPRARHTAPAEPPLAPSFQAGIIKSYYDAVDFGTGPGVIRQPQPRRRSSTLDGLAPLDGQNELALVLRPRSAPPGRQDFDDEYTINRPRSLSPESSPSRREWAQLSEIVES